MPYFGGLQLRGKYGIIKLPFPKGRGRMSFMHSKGGSKCEAMDEKSHRISFEPQIFAVLWHRLVDHQWVVIHIVCFGNAVSDPVDDSSFRRVYGTPVVSVYAGKADHTDDRHGTSAMAFSS